MRSTPSILTAASYAKRVRKYRGLVKRWLDAAEPGATLPGGGVVVVDPEGRKWIEVPRTNEAADV